MGAEMNPLRVVVTVAIFIHLKDNWKFSNQKLFLSLRLVGVIMIVQIMMVIVDILGLCLGDFVCGEDLKLIELKYLKSLIYY